ncbi:MAG: ABC transporter substrate-binding protein [Tissierellia bacterium]|nr:ABC transporter substrate-binding protein [Tissierellia bacterium]
MKKLFILFLGLIILIGCGQVDEGSGTSKKKVGIVQFAEHPSLTNCTNGFIEGIKEAYGENLEIDLKNATGEGQNAALITDQFVSKKYDLVCAVATPAAMSAFNSSDGIVPVVFSAVSDPVAAGLVESLESPGTNCTGTSDTLPIDTQLQLIKDLVPNASKIGILYTTSEVNSQTNLKRMEESSQKFGFEIIPIGINNADEIPMATDALLKKVDVITMLTDNKVVDNLKLITDKARAAGVPVFGSEEEQLNSGCVAAMNINYFDLGVETGKIGAELLKGKDAKEIPVMVIDSANPVLNPAIISEYGLEIPEALKEAKTYGGE